MTEDAKQYVGFIEQPVTEDGLLKLSKLADEQKKLEKEIFDVESNLEILRDKLKNISTELIPSLMEELGMQEFKTSSGLCIKVQEKLHCSIYKEKKAQALQWLIDNGFSSIVKNEVRVSFSKDEFNKAHELAETLRSDKFPALEEQNVHAQVLKSTISNCLKTGINVPLDLFSVFRQRSSVIG